jgi:hypothetical protein
LRHPIRWLGFYGNDVVSVTFLLAWDWYLFVFVEMSNFAQSYIANRPSLMGAYIPLHLEESVHGEFVMTDKTTASHKLKKQAGVAHPGMMGDGTEEQNLGERGRPTPSANGAPPNDPLPARVSECGRLGNAVALDPHHNNGRS